MNRLIIVGNGFDLAHGLKTSYKHFVDDLVLTSFSQANTSGKLDLPNVFTIWKNPHYSISIADRDLDYFVKFIAKEYRDGDFALFGQNPKLFVWTLENEFIKRILTQCGSEKWVDIENEYYREVKRIHKTNVEEHHKNAQLKSLNKSFVALTRLLETYLSKIKQENIVQGYAKLFLREFTKDDFVDYEPEELEKPKSILILNFNFTQTASRHVRFCKDHREDLQMSLINIHGQVKSTSNPIIFGYGDEIDDYYKYLEEDLMKGYLSHVKSLAYTLTTNYRDLIRFIESEPFQTVICGHSCGLSDRTMLNMVLEHENCKSIRLYYHEKVDGTDNYRELTEEILRQFKNKQSFRRKIVSKDLSEPMPQLSISPKMRTQ